MLRNEEDMYRCWLSEGLSTRMASHWLGDIQWEFVKDFNKSFGGDALPDMYEEMDKLVRGRVGGDALPDMYEEMDKLVRGRGT